MNKTARQVAAMTRRAEMLDMRCSGASYREIGAKFRVTRQRAHAVVTGELAKLAAEVAETADAVRQIELARLDAMTAGLWGGATTGDAKAVAAVLRIQERRARLLGLDTPIEIAAAGEVTFTLDLGEGRVLSEES